MYRYTLPVLALTIGHHGLSMPCPTMLHGTSSSHYTGVYLCPATYPSGTLCRILEKQLCNCALSRTECDAYAVVVNKTRPECPLANFALAADFAMHEDIDPNTVKPPQATSLDLWPVLHSQVATECRIQMHEQCLRLLGTHAPACAITAPPLTNGEQPTSLIIFTTFVIAIVIAICLVVAPLMLCMFLRWFACSGRDEADDVAAVRKAVAREYSLRDAARRAIIATSARRVAEGLEDPPPGVDGPGRKRLLGCDSEESDDEAVRIATRDLIEDAFPPAGRFDPDNTAPTFGHDWRWQHGDGHGWSPPVSQLGATLVGDTLIRVVPPLAAAGLVDASIYLGPSWDPMAPAEIIQPACHKLLHQIAAGVGHVIRGPGWGSMPDTSVSTNTSLFAGVGSLPPVGTLARDVAVFTPESVAFTQRDPRIGLRVVAQSPVGASSAVTSLITDYAWYFVAPVAVWTVCGRAPAQDMRSFASRRTATRGAGWRGRGVTAATEASTRSYSIRSDTSNLPFALSTPSLSGNVLFGLQTGVPAARTEAGHASSTRSEKGRAVDALVSAISAAADLLPTLSAALAASAASTATGVTSVAATGGGEVPPASSAWFAFDTGFQDGDACAGPDGTLAVAEVDGSVLFTGAPSAPREDRCPPWRGHRAAGIGVPPREEYGWARGTVMVGEESVVVVDDAACVIGAWRVCDILSLIVAAAGPEVAGLAGLGSSRVAAIAAIVCDEMRRMETEGWSVDGWVDPSISAGHVQPTQASFHILAARGSANSAPAGIIDGSGKYGGWRAFDTLTPRNPLLLSTSTADAARTRTIRLMECAMASLGLPLIAAAVDCAMIVDPPPTHAAAEARAVTAEVSAASADAETIAVLLRGCGVEADRASVGASVEAAARVLDAVRALVLSHMSASVSSPLPLHSLPQGRSDLLFRFGSGPSRDAFVAAVQAVALRFHRNPLHPTQPVAHPAARPSTHHPSVATPIPISFHPARAVARSELVFAPQSSLSSVPPARAYLRSRAELASAAARSAVLGEPALPPVTHTDPHVGVDATIAEAQREVERAPRVPGPPHDLVNPRNALPPPTPPATTVTMDHPGAESPPDTHPRVVQRQPSCLPWVPIVQFRCPVSPNPPPSSSYCAAIDIDHVPHPLSHAIGSMAEVLSDLVAIVDACTAADASARVTDIVNPPLASTTASFSPPGSPLGAVTARRAIHPSAAGPCSTVWIGVGVRQNNGTVASCTAIRLVSRNGPSLPLTSAASGQYATVVLSSSGASPIGGFSCAEDVVALTKLRPLPIDVDAFHVDSETFTQRWLITPAVSSPPPTETPSVASTVSSEQSNSRPCVGTDAGTDHTALYGPNSAATGRVLALPHDPLGISPSPLPAVRFGSDRDRAYLGLGGVDIGGVALGFGLADVGAVGPDWWAGLADLAAGGRHDAIAELFLPRPSDSSAAVRSIPQATMKSLGHERVSTHASPSTLPPSQPYQAPAWALPPVHVGPNGGVTPSVPDLPPRHEVPDPPWSHNVAEFAVLARDTSTAPAAPDYEETDPRPYRGPFGANADIARFEPPVAAKPDADARFCEDEMVTTTGGSQHAAGWLPRGVLDRDSTTGAVAQRGHDASSPSPSSRNTWGGYYSPPMVPAPSPSRGTGALLMRDGGPRTHWYSSLPRHPRH